MFQVSRKGFTLIELLVVMSIIGIMASLSVSSYLKSRNEEALSLSAQQISNDIRNVQNDAYSALKIDGDVPQGGYGIRFNVAADSKKKYIIFGDKDNNKSYDSGEEYLTVNLSNNITISGLKINGTEEASGIVDIIFVPPYGTTYINGDNAASRKLEITVAGPAGSKIIKVGVSGKVD